MSAVLTLDQANDIWHRYTQRRALFGAGGEDERTSFLVVVLNYGDQQTAVTCVGPEQWTGTKSELTPRDGIPHCPNGHPLLESNQRKRLGMVDDDLPTFGGGGGPAGTGRFA